MAKLSFKDMIFKFLKKDENLGAYGGVKQNPSKKFKVKFAMPNKPNNIAVAAYQFEKDAEKFKKDIIAKGGKAILTKEESKQKPYVSMAGGQYSVLDSDGKEVYKTRDKTLAFAYLKKNFDKLREDAPANATGTAVAGTGDDSSTVVVKKKKELQKKLMTRMGITETINRTIPDLEYPKDEIRERVNQLKELASIKEYELGDISKFTKYDRGDTPYIIRYGKDKVAKAMKIAVRSDGQYSKAVREIEKIGRNLSIAPSIAKALKTANEDLDAQPQDRDVKKIKGTQPKKYYKKMSKVDKEKRAKHFTTRDTTKNDNRPAPGDKGAKTKPSIHTTKFKKMYGEDMSLDEAIKGLQNKAKKTGMPYSILKKVYDRGMAAWRGGHRPGSTQQQWAFARVNSFVTKSSGTWGGADKDLAKKVRASK